MTQAQINRRNKFLKKKDREKANKQYRKAYDKAEILPWWTFLPDGLCAPGVPDGV